ncbi:MAG: insulinase family protein [Opitutaceae bacterium]|jgi:zinc protease|nr:insulinase family protein [Opitutaceae bacterium]
MNLRQLAALALAATAANATPPPAADPAFDFVRTLAGISEYTLRANGLQVLVMPDHSAPVATLMVTYRVGSRNEVTGTTGATHLLEHLMFKGTPAHNRDDGTSIDQFLERTGARYNATTWMDRTNYFATLGKQHLPRLAEIEADRMRNLWLRESDRRPEMTVVRNEFEIGENNPVQALDKEVSAAAYIAHPYHHSTIGWRSDIENVPIEKLREFYNTFYWPDNATVTLIGDLSVGDALALVKTHFSNIPRAPKPIPQIYTTEPPQTGPRRVVLKRAGQLGVVAIAHKTPAATHPDMPALAVLDAILADGKTSRLYRALTDKNIVTSAETDLGFHRDPSLHTTFLSLAPNIPHQTAETAALAEIARLKTEGVTPEEVRDAINRHLTASAYARDGSYAIASTLNEHIAAGDWTLYATFDESLKTVTPADVQRVARTYFNEDKSTTGWFIPLAE